MQGLAAERERINARLLETADLIQKSEGQLTSIETRLGELEEQERILKGSLDQRNNQIAKLLAALQRMGRNPPPVLITQREDALQDGAQRHAARRRHSPRSHARPWR